MDKNATVMPVAGAKPVVAEFVERPLSQASIAYASDGRLFVTGTPLDSTPRHGLQFWGRKGENQWERFAPRVIGPDLDATNPAVRWTAPHLTIVADKLFIAFADDQGCARIATGDVARPGADMAASACLAPDAPSPSLFVDDDGLGYLLWGGGWIARLAPGFAKLAEAPRFLKPDAANFAETFPAGKDWPVRTRIGTDGAFMVKHGGKYWLGSSEQTGRLRTATTDLFLAEGKTPYGPFSRRMLAVPHAGESSVASMPDGTLAASYDPVCEDDFAFFCHRIGIVPLEAVPDGRLRQAGRILTEDSAVAGRHALVTSKTMRDPSVTVGGDGAYYLVGTLDGYGYQFPDGGIKVWRSTDLENWTDLGFAWQWTGLSYEFGNIAELWAPEIRWVPAESTFYLAFSIMERGVGGKTWLFRSTSGKAQGPYENTGSSYLVKGIDGFLYPEGKDLYFLWGGGRLAKLNADRSGFVDKPTQLVDTAGDHIGYEGNGIIKVGDTYFVTGAEWHGPLRTHGTYDMMYAASQSIAGPYTRRRLGAPHGGHGTPFRDTEGRYWYTMFGNDPTAPWRMHFALVPIEIGDAMSIRTLPLEATPQHNAATGH
ncbi:family 43 glycosylhydrolase [Tsuneonella dongtanensis]|nr:family 43 glycosylhydrolase [Tsuneonella dongtanensis]